jgi:hypothetical protein
MMNHVVLYPDKPLDQDYWDAQYKAKTTGWDLFGVSQLKII